MAEPTSTAAATLVAAAASLPLLTVMGIPLGLRVDLLIAGFGGALVAMAFFNTVPASDDTVRALLRVTLKRIGWAIASSLTAGYVTPLAMLFANIPSEYLASGAFAVGGSARWVLKTTIKRVGGAGLEPQDKQESAP